MVGSNAVFGCASFVIPTPKDADYFLAAQMGSAVNPAVSKHKNRFFSISKDSFFCDCVYVFREIKNFLNMHSLSKMANVLFTFKDHLR